jgi:undecaprenyl-diphosphatase
MEWWQAILLGLVQGLTEFLPVSSSGHLMIFKELLGVDGEGFLDFTVTVHLATVLSTILVFWAAIRQLLKGLLQFRYNDETDYIAKICVSMIPVFVVGMFFKDQVESLFGENLTTVAVCLLVTAALLFFSDHFGRWFQVCPRERRNGISFLQAFVVGLGQACAVAPGLSRSGTTIAVGLISGVKRDVMAQFSFLMVLVPILGEAFLDIVGGDMAASSIGLLPLVVGFLAAFVSGLFACSVMIALVRRARLSWFALYCAIVGILVLVFA